MSEINTRFACPNCENELENVRDDDGFIKGDCDTCGYPVFVDERLTIE